MYKFKRGISLFITSVMLFSCVSMSAFANEPMMLSPSLQADETAETKNDSFANLDEEVIVISANADGTYSSGPNASLKANALRVHASTEYEDIYVTPDSRYFQKAGEGTYLEVKPVSGLLTDYSTYQTMKQIGMPKEVLEDIAGLAAVAQEEGRTNVVAKTFVPLLAQETAASAEQSGDRNVLPRVTTTWNGETFYHYQVYFTNWWQQDEMAHTGATTDSELNGFVRIGFAVAVEVAGYIVDEIPIVGTAVNLFQSGWSVLQVVLDVQEENEEIHYENPRNNVRVDISPNIYLKYTYVLNDFGYEKLGCVSQSIFISKVKTTGFFYAEWEGIIIEESYYPNRTVNSTSYNAPEETAYLYKSSAYSRREHIVVTVFGKTFEIPYPTFSWPSDWP